MSEHDKRLTRSQAERGCGKVWRLATAGGDNLVMIWLVYPKPTISQVNQHREAYQSPHQPPPPTLDPKSLVDLKHTHPPIIEYLATLTKHQGVVNVVRFCPKGEMLASAGDDGNVLLWVLSTNTTSTSFGESAADKAYERESWRTRLMLRGPAQCEIYDLAWSPCGDFILTGDTAKTARIWNVTDGSCIKQIAEHSNFVQGVAWDPLGEYIATQSSDRSMNVYSILINKDESGAATAEVHHIAKNYKIDLLTQQTNSWTNFQISHHEKDDHNASSTRSLPTNTTNDTPNDTSAPNSTASNQPTRPKLPSRTVSNAANIPESPSHHPSPQINSGSRVLSIPPTPTTASSTLFNEDSNMQPPSEIPHHVSVASAAAVHVRNLSSSRQSSVVSSQAISPSIRPIRSPSPVPPLPAIHVNEEKRSSSVLLYGDEGANAFFRRLTWSNDGSTLITPAGRWESRFGEVEPAHKSVNNKGKAKDNGTESTGKKRRKRRTTTNDASVESTDELDQFGVGGIEQAKETPTVFIYGRGTIGSSSNGKTQVCQPIARLPGHRSSSVAIRFSPIIYRLNPIKSPCERRSKKPAQSLSMPPVQVDLFQGAPMQEIDLNKPPSQHHHQDHDNLRKDSSANQTDQPKSSPGIFDLPYRMIYAVATHDTVYIYDTQQSSPICLLSNLHFSSFTDLSWTSDGETLILSSSDGYCSLVVFDKGELGERLSAEEEREHLPSTLLNDDEADQPKERPKREEILIIESHLKTTERPVPTGGNLAKANEDELLGASGGDCKEGRKRDADQLSHEQPRQQLGDSSVIPATNEPQKKKKRVALTYEGPVQG